jgi:hypothetical protein
MILDFGTLHFRDALSTLSPTFSRISREPTRRISTQESSFVQLRRADLANQRLSSARMDSRSESIVATTAVGS